MNEHEDQGYGTPQYVEPTPPPPRPRRRGTLGRIVRILAVLVGGFFLLSVLSAILQVTQEADLTEKLVRGDSGASQKIVIVPVEGPIFQSPAGYSEGAFSVLRRGLAKARADKEVKAVVLAVDSPGGGVTASDILHHEIKDFREKGVPIVVLMGSLGTSGAYYVSAPADWIVAHPTTVTGSIGVITWTLNVGGFLQRHDIEDVAIKSGQNKDIMSPFRPMTDEERRLMQQLVDGMFQRFKEVVEEGRVGKLVPEQMELVLDGRVLSAQDARKAGLVDDIGYLEDAISKAHELGSVGASYKVVRYERTPGFVEKLLSGSTWAPRPLGKSVWMGLAARAEPFHYIWREFAPPEAVRFLVGNREKW